MRPIATTDADQVLAQAERCRREARAKVESNPLYWDLTSQPSGWCVVTEKHPWSRQYHTMVDEDHLRERIERGHRVVLIVGLVANPNIALCPSNHVAITTIGEPRTHNSETLADIGVRAKVCAATALFSR
jgi:hypothetical protein